MNNLAMTSSMDNDLPNNRPTFLLTALFTLINPSYKNYVLIVFLPFSTPSKVT